MKLLPRKNNLKIGLLIGLLVPLVGYGLLTALYFVLEKYDLVSTAGFSPMFRERTVAIVAIALNAVAINMYNSYRATQTIRGIVLVTFALVIIWLIYFGKIIFSN